MPDRQVPLVLVPRYTTFVGGGDFQTEGVRVQPYDAAVLTVWRGALLGSSAGIQVAFAESNDRDEWFTCEGGDPFAPEEGTEAVREINITRTYLRVEVSLTGTDPAATVYITGYLVCSPE